MFSLCLSLVLAVSVVRSTVPPTYGGWGRNGCTHKTITVGGYVSGGSQDAVLMYPTEAYRNHTHLPFLTFAHGMTAGGSKTYSAYSTLWDIVCSYGYIIVGTMACPEKYCQNYYKDVITTIKTCASKKGTLDPVLAYADFTKIGVYGHSMGGAATVHTSDEKNLNIVSSVAMHPSVVDDIDKSESADVAVPMLWFTGSSDTTVPPNGVYNGYNQDKVLPKIFAEIKGATHNNHVNNEGPYVGMYMDCHIKGNQNGCSYFYAGANSRNNICSGGMAMTRCMVDGNVTATST